MATTKSFTVEIVVSTPVRLRWEIAATTPELAIKTAEKRLENWDKLPPEILPDLELVDRPKKYFSYEDRDIEVKGVT